MSLRCEKGRKSPFRAHPKYAIAQQINIEPEKVVYYPAVEENFMQIIARHASQNMQVGGNRIDAETLKLIQFINYVRTMAPIQARMQPLEIR